MFESVNKDTKKDFLKRALRLLIAWEKSSTFIFAESFIPDLRIFMHQATR